MSSGKGSKKEDKSVPFVKSRYVKNLSKKDFHQFINEKAAALVMFYNPECQFCQNAKPHFVKAANTVSVKNRSFAAVDCTKDDALCENENITRFPSFKLYVGGKYYNKFNQAPHYTSLRTFAENAPVEQEEKPTTFNSQPPPAQPGHRRYSSREDL